MIHETIRIYYRNFCMNIEYIMFIVSNFLKIYMLSDLFQILPITDY